MPEGYTHFRVAAKAAAAVRYKIKWPAAFAAGANGPDIFFCYQAWRKAAKRRYDLPALGTRLHEDDTGAFLLSLVRHVRTGPQVEYTLGFLSHYATDALLHPYVAALCAPGMPYAGPGGHGYFEIALDSTLHAADTGSAVVPAAEACPTPAGSALADIVALLHAALLETYGLDIPAEYLADSFYHSTKLRGPFTSRFGVRRWLFGLIEPLFGGKGTITGHVSPRRLADGLPAAWTDPYSGAQREGDAYALLQQAQERSARYMAAAILIWTGHQPLDTLAEALGSVSYSEGRPTPRSDPNYTAPPAAEESTAPAEQEAPAPVQAAAAPTPAQPEVPAPAPLPPQPAPQPDIEPTAPQPPIDEDALLAEGLAMIEAARAERAEQEQQAAPPEETAPTEEAASAAEAAPPEEATPAEDTAPDATQDALFDHTVQLQLPLR